MTLPVLYRTFANEVLPAENRREEDEYGQYPRQEDNKDNRVICTPLAILARSLDTAVAIDCDAEDGVDGRQADGVVAAEPQVAQELAERPRLVQQVDGVERHRYHANQQVAARQRRQEEVSGDTYVAVNYEGENYHEIAPNSHQDCQSG